MRDRRFLYAALVFLPVLAVLGYFIALDQGWLTRSASPVAQATAVVGAETPTPSPTTAPTATPTGTAVVKPNATKDALGAKVGSSQSAQQTGTPTGTSFPAVMAPTETPVLAPCRLDKVNTANEVPSGPQRIEVGGHGGQHVDFYPNKGIASVSYLVPAIPDPDGTPMIWSGYGSIWEAPLAPECAGFDWVADAAHYALARLDSGHSGLVVDLRGGSPEVVANVAGLTNDEIDDLLATHAAGQTSQTGATACVEAARDDRAPIVGTPWESNPSGGWVVINFWSNEPGADQAEHKLLLAPGDNPLLLGGGSRWTWSESCESTATAAYNSNPLPEITLAELEEMELVVPNDD